MSFSCRCAMIDRTHRCRVVGATVHKLDYGRGVLNKVFYGEAPLRRPSAFMYHFFDKTGSPFVYLLLTNGTPFTHLVKDLHPYNCCKFAVY